MVQLGMVQLDMVRSGTADLVQSDMVDWGVVDQPSLCGLVALPNLVDVIVQSIKVTKEIE